jgi:hypothetical protein
MCAVYALDMSLHLIKYNQLLFNTLMCHIFKLQIQNVKYDVKNEQQLFQIYTTDMMMSTCKI